VALCKSLQKHMFGYIQVYMKSDFIYKIGIIGKRTQYNRQYKIDTASEGQAGISMIITILCPC